MRYVRTDYQLALVSDAEFRRIEEKRKRGAQFTYVTKRKRGAPKGTEYLWLGGILESSEDLLDLIDEFVRKEDGEQFSVAMTKGVLRRWAAEGKRDEIRDLDLIGAIWTPRGLKFVARLRDGELGLEDFE